MRRRFTALAVLLAGQAAWGSVHVTQFNGSTNIGSQMASSGAAISISLASGVDRIEVTVDSPSTESIGRIKFTSGSSNAIRLQLGTEYHASTTDPIVVVAGQNWGGIDPTGSSLPNLELYGAISGNLTNDVAGPSNQLGKLSRLQVGGALNGSIYAAGGGGTGKPFTVVCGYVSSGKNIWMYNSNETLSRVETTNGDMAGEIRAVAGNIGDIVVGGSSNLTGRVLAVQGSITSIDVGGAITSAHWNAGTTTETEPNGGWPDVIPFAGATTRPRLCTVAWCLPTARESR